jgi:DNA-binding HxlR family transcriptional regulator
VTNSEEPFDLDGQCRKFRVGADLMAGRWSAAILGALASGADRYVDVRHAVEGISDRMLSQRLKELQENGLISRSVQPTTPVQVRYSLTERGSTLLKSLIPLIRWGQQWENGTGGTTGGAGNNGTEYS